MSHIVELIADYLENRLTPEQRHEVEMHRDACGECAAAIAFAMKLHEEALAQGLAHIRPDRIVALSGNRASATKVEAAHLDACENCRREMEWAAEAVDEAAEEADEDSRPRHTLTVARRWWPAAAVVAAAAIALIFMLPRGPHDGSDMTGFVRIEPLPVNITRGSAEPGTFEATRLRGLEQYRDGDYSGAITAFEEALSLRDGDAEVLLYLGSAELLQGNPASAARHLASGASRADSPALREELLWQLAQAQLASGHRAEAERSLRDVIALRGRRAALARTILEEIGK